MEVDGKGFNVHHESVHGGLTSNHPFTDREPSPGQCDSHNCLPRLYFVQHKYADICRRKKRGTEEAGSAAEYGVDKIDSVSQMEKMEKRAFNSKISAREVMSTLTSSVSLVFLKLKAE